MTLMSVVIPSYNHEQYIRHAVESVLTQSHVDLELIVVDDGSTDRSIDYLRGVQDDRFRLVEQANSGAHNAINRGLEMAQGDYLAILNSDDIFHHDRLAVCLKRLQAGADLVVSWLEVIDYKGKVLGVKEGWRNMLPWPITPPPERLASVDPFIINLLQTNFVSTTSNIIFSQKLYKSVGTMENLRFTHDWDYLLRAVKEFKCELIERPLLQYRIHANNTISTNRSWMMFEICWIYAVHTSQVLNKVLPSSNDTKMASAELSFLWNSINVQGCDKMLWMILQFVERHRSLGCQNANILLLNDISLRNEFISYIE